jgi:pimeloyl-ACP methyl ester carboxylesterase
MRFDVDGRTVNATTGGLPLDSTKPLLVFVHGAGADRTVWALQTRYFANHGCSVLAVDLPGHGKSDGPVPDSVRGFSMWLAAVIEATGFERAVIAGHSMGAYIAIDLAARRLDLATRLVLAGTAATMRVHPALLESARADEHLAVELMTGWSFPKRAQLGGHPTPGSWMIGQNERLTERALDGALGVDLTTANGHADAVESVRQVTCPVLYLLGERDVMTPMRNAAELIQATPNAAVVTLPGTGHVMMWERPHAVIDAIADFLGDQ